MSYLKNLVNNNGIVASIVEEGIVQKQMLVVHRYRFIHI